MISLKTPLKYSDISKLKVGDQVSLSGTIYTARDEAHIKIQKEGFPFDPVGAVIYHCGPVIDKNKIIAAGPTTSARMNNLTQPILDGGVRAIIGKGGMSKNVLDLLKDRAVYLAFTGGCAVLAASCMKLVNCYYSELGMAESIWEFQVTNLPLIVGMDAHGGNLFDNVDKNARLKSSSIDYSIMDMKL